MCFSYFSLFDLTETFYALNQRFDKLILHQPTVYIDIDRIADGKLFTTCFRLHDFLSKSHNELLAISASNEHRFTMMMRDDLFRDKFSKLKSLTLLCMHAEAVYSTIFDERMRLCETLERITLSEVSDGEEHGSTVQRKWKLVSRTFKGVILLCRTIYPIGIIRNESIEIFECQLRAVSVWM